MKIKIIESFKDKKFKYGGYAALLVAIVLAILAGVNLLVDQIPYKADLTREKMFSISDQTVTVLTNLDKEVTIYVLSEIGRENLSVKEILAKYGNRTKNLSVEYIDPYRNPEFVKKFEKDGREPGKDSLIVNCGEKFRIISPYDMINYRSTGNPNDPYEQTAQSLKIEQVLTGAVLYVAADRDTTLYFLQGHRESTIPYELKSQLESENIIVKDLNLITEEKVPEDASIILIISPEGDISESEEEKIRDFLFKRKGRAVFMMDLQQERIETPNLSGLLKSYGVALDPVLIFEGDNSCHLPNYPLGLIPKMAYSSITESMISDKIPILFPFAQGITELDIKRQTIEIKPLLTTSEKSWGKTDLESLAQEKGAEDKDGPFNVVVAIIDKGLEGEKDSKAIITGGSYLLYPERALGISGPGNTDFFLNSLNWLEDKEEHISIRPKSLMVMPLRMTQFQFYLFSAIVVIFIPLIVFGLGLVVWLRRRHL